MPLDKRVDIEVLPDSWEPPATPPASLTTAAQTSPATINVLCALMFTASWTRPPVRYGFSLADCWAWLRYFPAVAPTPDLRLCDEWTMLDPHQKTVLSGDFGVGFTTWFLVPNAGLHQILRYPLGREHLGTRNVSTGARVVEARGSRPTT